MGYITSQSLTTALAILGTVPQSNPCISPAYSFFTTAATTVVPTIPTNQTIYVSTSVNADEYYNDAGSAVVTV